MKVYRSNAASLLRILFGVDLVEGLRAFPQTETLAGPFEVQNEALSQTYERRVALQRPLARARARRRVAEQRLDALLRQLARALELADGGRRGALFGWILPEGLGAVVAATGKTQAEAVVAVLSRMVRCRLPGAETFLPEWQPRLQAGQAAYQEVLDGFAAAQTAYLAAFQDELALREEHLLAVSKLKGLVAAAFPRERELQETVWPQLDSAGVVAPEDEEAAGAGPTDATQG